MKIIYLTQKLLKSLCLCALCIGIFLPCRLYAIDVSIGATTWCAWMDQEYTKIVSSTISSNTENKNPALFLGPALSVKFNDDFNLTFICLYGKFDITESYPYASTDYTLKRYDADLAINYRLNDYFKVFGGTKYMKFSIHRDNSSAAFFYGEISKRDRLSIGPCLGLNASFPIFENLFILAHLSGHCLFNKESSKYTDTPTNEISLQPNGYDYGINSGLSLAYYITAASTTINLGGRFQYIKTNYTSGTDSYHGSYCDHNASMFYGVTLTATYSFKI